MVRETSLVLSTWKKLEGRNLSYVKHEARSKLQFEEFVKDMLYNPATNKHWMNIHAFSMSLILLKTLFNAYFYTIANLTTEWPRFVGKQHCPGVSGNIASTPMEFLGQHKSLKDLHGTFCSPKEVWRDQGTTVRVIVWCLP